VTKPQLAVTLSGLHRTFGDLRSYVDCAKAVEAAGADQVVVADHVVMGERIDRYPFGRFPFKPEEPWIEPLTTLSAIAIASCRLVSERYSCASPRCAGPLASPLI